MKHICLIIFASMMLTGCVPMPTQQDLAGVDYGVPINQADAEAEVQRTMQGYLKDPQSASYQCQPITTSWMSQAGAKIPIKYGYGLACGINAKNSFGGYTGAEQYLFLFRHRELTRAQRVENGMQMTFIDN